MRDSARKQFLPSTIAAAVLACLTLFSGVSRGENLQYFKNYFVTGDYATAGVGLRASGIGGWATGTINMTGVPIGADIVAAYLYWSTDEPQSTPMAINGFFRGQPIVGRVIGNTANPTCWSSGGTSGASGSAARTYRSDVLRDLPIDPVRNVRVVTSEGHTVRLPDSGGNGNGNVLYTNGATLVVIYRVVTPGIPPGSPAAPLFRSVVIYDGAYTMLKNGPGLFQSVGGFYQAAPGAGRMTHLVANGGPGDTTTVKVNGLTVGNTNSFRGALGARWDNPEFAINLPTNASSFTTEATTTSNQVCLTWSAVITSVKVTDTDYDGLLNIWEESGLHLNPGNLTTPATFGTCSYYSDCLNLPAMGALPGTPDIFSEIDWMRDSGHEHKPKLNALLMVAQAFKNHGIRLHWDVGNNYQGSATGPDKFIVPASYAQGGELVEEDALACPNPLIVGQTAAHCVFPNLPYAALGWKIGFRGVKDGFPALNIAPHFAKNRKDTHHYVLFGHALAIPFSPNTGIPKSVSGIADRPGGDAGVFLGLWRSDVPENDQVGSVVAQAGTLMHEVGHNLGLSHGGVYRIPNCMPNYQSIMNYLYQTRGLTDAFGSPQMDFSKGSLSQLNENFLSETTGLGPLDYRVRYYGPYRSGIDSPDGAAKLHCDGTAIGPGEAPMIRLENSYATFLDWDHNAEATAGDLRLDTNYSGVFGDLVGTGNVFVDSNDWYNLNLQQVGARLNVNGLSVDVGQTDLGQTDLGQTDLGQTDLGQTDLGQTDLGQTDLGQTDLGQTDLGQTDLGDIDYDTVVLSTIDSPQNFAIDVKIDRITLTFNPPDTGQILEHHIYRSVNNGPFTLFTTLPGGQTSISFDDIVVIGSSTDYNIPYLYKVTSVVDVLGKRNESGATAALIGTVKHLFVAGLNLSRPYRSANPAVLFTVEGLDLPAPAAATCTTTATPSSRVGDYPILCTGPATTANPVNGITYTNGLLTITRLPASVTTFAADKVYGSPDPVFTGTLTGFHPADGVAAVYTRTTGETVLGGPYTIGATLTPSDVLDNYVITYNMASFTILPKPASVAPAAANKIYGNPDPVFTGTLTDFLPADGVAAVYTRTTGETVLGGPYTISATLTPSAVLSNYTITYNTASFTILPKPASVAPAAANKIYGNPDPVFTGTLTGFLPADGVTAVYTRTTGETVLGGPYTISAALSPAAVLSNYTITYSTAQFTILPRPITATADAKTKVYGTADPAFTYTLPSGSLINPDTLSGALTRVLGENAGAYAIQKGTLTGSSNYVLTFISANLTITPAPQTIDFPSIADKTLGNPPFTPAASATSGLPVAFTLAPGTWQCTVTGNVVTLTGAGNCSVTAGQVGNNNYLPAIPVTRTFRIGGILGFSATGSMIAIRSYHTATLLADGKVLVAGGFGAPGQPLASAEVYNPATGAFSSTQNNMPNKAAGHTATRLKDGRVLLVGGGNSNSQIYEPSTNSFNAASGLGVQRTYHTATLLTNGKVLIAGGGDSSARPLNTAQLYDPVAGSYSNTGNMTAPREFHTATLLTSGPNAGKVLITGGRTGNPSSPTYLASAELYDPVSGTFQAVASSLGIARYGHTATVLNGKIVIAGGGNPSAVTGAVLYDTDALTPAFTPINPLSTGRREAASVAFAGTVVVMGGTTGVTTLQSVELTAGSTFTPGANMTAPRVAHTATPIVVNSVPAVLIVGGKGAGGSSERTAEILK